MGFILPFALTFVAIPLETFVHSARQRAGRRSGRWRCAAPAFALRLLGNAAAALGELLVRLYDVVIFLPLWVRTPCVAGRRRVPRSGRSRPASGVSQVHRWPVPAPAMDARPSPRPSRGRGRGGRCHDAAIALPAGGRWPC